MCFGFCLLVDLDFVVPGLMRRWSWSDQMCFMMDIYIYIYHGPWVLSRTFYIFYHMGGLWGSIHECKVWISTCTSSLHHIRACSSIAPCKSRPLLHAFWVQVITGVSQLLIFFITVGRFFVCFIWVLVTLSIFFG